MSGERHQDAILKRFKSHSDLAKLETLLPAIRELQKLASEHGIHDVFQDNGGKLLQMLLVTGLKALPGREGNDARDVNGREYEMKSVNRFNTKGKRKPDPQFTTHHHLNPTIIDKYRKVDWLFAVYSGIELEAVYYMGPDTLQPLFTKWQKDYAQANAPLNNPKINLTFVEKYGFEVYRNQQAPKPSDEDFLKVLGDVASPPTAKEREPAKARTKFRRRKPKKADT